MTWNALKRVKKLLIDAILLEAIHVFPTLKIWKGVALESEIAQGAADCLVTENRGYFEAPFICVVEAKKDDFSQGLAQCLIEMQACQWSNQTLGRSIAIFGIVTNGGTWQFYQLMGRDSRSGAVSNQVYKTWLYSIGDLQPILGQLHWVFQTCEQNL